MRVELLYFGGCPGYRKAERALRIALSEEGMPGGSAPELVAVDTDEEAERLRFPGSPTIRVDGEDLFPEGLGQRASWHIGCRVYRAPEGLEDHPSAEMIRTRLLRKQGERG
ncbi:thioredoxin family protein (plasmid) [Rubrobacter tropicus]|uniref:Thioredoxin family protein n=1 Tax=Rubrobacter tropicus TaxID=2653851 RepID=A0A6G8QG23_9ACTN|nr:thioredoxin family protein [Rubrobacter tropicus]QIN85351.1 thioredoxin family protein [Rubrobacter tropicus]